MYMVRHLMERSQEQIHGILSTVGGSIGEYVDMGLLRAFLKRCRTSATDAEIYRLYDVLVLARWVDRVGVKAREKALHGTSPSVA